MDFVKFKTVFILFVTLSISLIHCAPPGTSGNSFRVSGFSSKDFRTPNGLGRSSAGTNLPPDCLMVQRIAKECLEGTKSSKELNIKKINEATLEFVSKPGKSFSTYYRIYAEGDYQGKNVDCEMLLKKNGKNKCTTNMSIDIYEFKQ